MNGCRKGYLVCAEAGAAGFSTDPVVTFELSAGLVEGVLAASDGLAGARAKPFMPPK